MDSNKHPEDASSIVTSSATESSVKSTQNKETRTFHKNDKASSTSNSQVKTTVPSPQMTNTNKTKKKPSKVFVGFTAFLVVLV